MQLLQNECQESNEQQQQQHQQQQQKQTSMTQDKSQQPSPEHKMDKFHPPKPKINAFNDLFTCFLCHGYMINPTTIDVCLHTYCRSCVVRHLKADYCCPQCGKPTTISNLVSDEVLRSIIFKLVPGLYQKERERVEQFLSKAKSDKDLNETAIQALSDSFDHNDHLLSPSDPISLSLELHPALAEQCARGSVPAVRYLQCPASIRVQHLKRFICTKFEIDPSNRKVGIDIIYEEEILPSDFTLMDIAYTYNWQRNAPLKLTYRILIYNEDSSHKSDCGYVSDDKASENAYQAGLEKSIPATFPSEAERSQGSVNNGKVDVQTISSPSQSSKSKVSKSSSTKHTSFHAASSNPEVPVKVTISRKPSESKKSVSKKSSATDEFVMPTTTNDFKSLRSNDIRFSDYAITSSTTNTIDPSSHTSIAKSMSQQPRKEKTSIAKEEKPSKCDIVVSIPHNQMHEEWDTKPLSHLKTASKKSPNSSTTEAAAAPAPAKKVRNVPKLKIELNSLKTKLIEKPKSADIRLDTLMIKQHRPRKFSLDEPQPVVEKVDLETYVRNIGLKPIEVQTTNKLETSDKHTPNASPMSSCSSTTSSSTSNFNFNCSADITSSSSSSSHKKRKKKHSKQSRESKDSKRKKMHAEISSHSAEESLKMKVKLTTPINLKSLKLDSKKPSSFCFEKTSDPLDFEKSKHLNSKIERKLFETPKTVEDKFHERSNEKLKSRSSETKKSKPAESKLSIPDVKKQQNNLEKPKPSEIKTALNDAINRTSTKDFDDDEDLVIPDSTSLGLTKSLSAIREAKLPHSPPLPPSLFKTTPLTFSTFSPNVAAVAKPKHIALPKDKPKPSHMKPIAPKPILAKPGQQSSLSPISSSLKAPKFLVPNPPRFMASNTAKFLSTPTSIASAANKHMGNLLKRSISLDETKNTGPATKQQRLEKPNQITVSAYGSNLHMTKVEIPATPTSSTAKATYEIPLYSPLSASYNPKCSFSVNSTTSVAKSTNSLLQIPTTSSSTRVKHTFTANALATNKTDADVKKTTSNDIKPSTDTTSSTTAESMAYVTNKIATTATNSMTTLMGPPLPIQKLNSSLAVATAAVVPPPKNTILPFSSPSTLNSTSPAQPTPVLNTAYLSSPLSMVNYRQGKVLLAHAKPTNLSEMKIEKQTSTAATTTATAIKTSAATTNGLATEKPKSSLRQFRLPSRESGQDILDLSASTKTAVNGVAEKQTSKPVTSLIPASHGSSLEMALNKIKQNMSSTTTTAATNAAIASNTTSSNTLDNGIKKPELMSPISDDLQNLHLLSESATAREKIAISTASALSSTSASLYEKAKITQNSLVRQQNASVRNIPNPSALAFRNQQPAAGIPPMVTIAAGLANTLSSLDKPLLLKTPSPPKSPHSPNCTTSSTSPSRTATKKHPSIDQVAASLNQRASAAAEASAKANSKLSDETLLVSSTSSSLTEKLESKEIKQESAELQGDTVATRPSSTVNTCPLVSVLDIKKEPEEKPEETASEIKAPAPISATAKKPTMVENLVTSVISVNTPTSTLLTATTAAGF